MSQFVRLPLLVEEKVWQVEGNRDREGAKNVMVEEVVMG